jgi:hypothetical protein
MLAIDSLVTDLIFQRGDALDPAVLLEALGGEEELSKKQVIDPDMQDPRFEMELSPSMPFRRRGERRIMVVDDSVAPMREDPRNDRIVPIDLRPAKEELIGVCEKVPVRLGRLFALGSWGDAVWVVHSLRDLRAICLLSWVLDPQMDVDGRRRATPLSQPEFEEKVLAYDKRLDELDDAQILESLDDAKVERRGDLIIVDLLEEDGSWDQNRSLVTEVKVAALERFSVIPGARSSGSARKEEAASDEVEGTMSAPAGAPEPTPPPPQEVPSDDRPPLGVEHLGDHLVLIFPEERFDLDVAAALGKGDWESIIGASDHLKGPDRDTLFRHGAQFVAPIEFLSEVFDQGVPLSKKDFEERSQSDEEGNRSMEAHFPRFGQIRLIERRDGRRFVTSMSGDVSALIASLP